MAQGGKGGDVKVVGKRGKAYGGPGGAGGPGEGAAGAGGGAVVVGDDAVAQGGPGGNCGTPDGRGGRRTQSPAQLQNASTFLWAFGYGGAGANHPEYNRRLGLLTRYRQEYRATFACDVPFIDAGIDPVPIEWINKRLEEEGERWRVEMGAGGYLLPPLPAP